MINESLFKTKKEKKIVIEYSNQVCECGKHHKILSTEVGTHKSWVCGECLDKESKGFDVWFGNLRIDLRSIK